MKLNLLKVGISLIPLLSVAFADECTDIKNIIEKVSKCIVNTEGKAVELDISLSNIETMPDIISNLDSLKILNLYYNELETLPDFIGNLTNLEELYLTRNKLKTLPDSMSNLKNLKQLNLDDNSFNTFPEVVTKLSNLEKLSIMGNNNITELPYEIVNLQNLETFDLPYTGLSIIPGFLAELKSLKSLEIRNDSIDSNFCISKKLLDNEINCSVYLGVYQYPNISNCYLRYNICDEEGNIINMPPIQTISNYKIGSFYNANRKKCLRNNGVRNTSITYGDCDNSKNSLWIIHNSRSFIHSFNNSDYCLSMEMNSLTLGYCTGSYYDFYYTNNTIIYRSPAWPRFTTTLSCVTMSDNDSNKADTDLCNENDPDQIWIFNEWEPSVTIYLYNSFKNKCITSDGSSVTTGSCNNDNALWEIPTSHNGSYRSKAYPNKCLSIIDGIVSVSECNETTKLYRDGNFIRSPLSDSRCIASSKIDQTLKYVEGCDVSEPDQLWFYNIWDSNVVIEETPAVEQQEMVTIYFYNPLKNVCITSDGSSVTTGNCSDNDDALWEIPVSHGGYFRSKTHPEKCLSIIDENVSVSDCNENTILYRDGHSIKSPLSEDRCIASSQSGSALEYVDHCDANDANHIWYFNIWTPPADSVTPTSITEEKSTVTITSTVTAIMTEAF